MLNHYLVLAVKVLLRRKFFTFISLFGIGFTLLVLTVVTALYEDSRTVHSYLDGRKVSSKLKRTDDEYWRILEFQFLEGGPFGTAELAEARFVAVINQTTRQRIFDGRDAVGQALEADGQRF